MVDSGACTSVAPPTCAPEYSIKQTEASRAGKTFTVANGQKLPNMGDQKVIVKVGNVTAGMKFSITDVVKPLASVSDIIENDNEVIFRKDCHGGSVIRNLKT